MPAESGQLTVAVEGRSLPPVPLSPGLMSIGRAPENTLPLHDPMVSRRHAELKWENDALVLTDLGSATGTFLEDKRLAAHQPYRLEPGAKFSVGRFTFTYLPGPSRGAEVGGADPGQKPGGPLPGQGSAGGQGEPVVVSLFAEDTRPVQPSSAAAPPVPIPTPAEPVAAEAPPAPVAKAVRVSESAAPAPEDGRSTGSRPQRGASSQSHELPKASPPGGTLPPSGRGSSLPPVPPERPRFPPPFADPSESRYLSYLPGIYQENDFVGRFLALLETLWEPLEWRQDHLEKYFDPSTCPAPFLAFLGRWIDVPLNPRWPELRRRRLLSEAFELYRWQGTSYGLARILEVCTGQLPDIVEDPEQGFVFRVIFSGAAGLELDRALIEELIRTHKPAHAGYILEIKP